MMERSEEDPSVAALVRDAITGVRGLVRVEVALAADDARRELRSAKRALLIGGVALVAITTALPILVMALMLSLGGAAGALAAVGGVSLAISWSSRARTFWWSVRSSS